MTPLQHLRALHEAAGKGLGGLQRVYRAQSEVDFETAVFKALPALLACAEAASGLLGDVKARHPGEELHCPFMQAIEKALEQLNKAVGDD